MTPETALINEYLAKHGARRFEQGATSGIHGIRHSWLNMATR
ncbi:hypothetical protein C038_00897 [Brucella sp. 63/311]|nr:hypothetical protein C038_00897 [Brucella sp. 63/311]